jgi:RND family efflux transporter MFP subunit
MTRICVCASASFLLVAGCGRNSVEEIESSTAVPVVVAAAVVKTIQGTITTTGVVAPAPGADLVVSAPEAARIAEIAHGEGDRVRKGELLVRFEIPTMTATVEQRRAELEQAKVRVEQARASVERLTGLFERGVAARKDVEDARRELADAQAALVQAASGAAAAGALAERSTVHAPFAGVVAKRWHNPGDIVEPAATDPILRLIDPERVEAVAAVPIADVARVAPRQRARVAAPGGLLVDAVVASLPAAVDPASATASVRLTLKGPQRLAVGTPVQIEIFAETRDHALVVPSDAIVHEGEQSIAVVAGTDKKAHRKPVTLGLTAGNETEVRAGIAPGDLVIVKGQAALPDGAAIAVNR